MLRSTWRTQALALALACIFSTTSGFALTGGRAAGLVPLRRVTASSVARRGAQPSPLKLVSQFQMPELPDWLPKFGPIGGPAVLEPPAPSAPPPPPPRLPMLKGKLIKACDEAQKGVAGTGSMSQEDFDALVDEICSLNPTSDPAVRSICQTFHAQ
jgi:hypothetical protein